MKPACRSTLLLSLLLGAGIALAAPPETKTAPEGAGPPPLETKAVDILKASSAKLAAAKAVSFTAVVSYESSSRLGPPLVYTAKSDVTMQRPNKLKVVTLGDGPATEFYYDGKVVMAYAPAEELVAVADAPATVDETLAAVYTSAAIYYPFEDVIVTDWYKDIAAGPLTNGANSFPARTAVPQPPRTRMKVPRNSAPSRRPNVWSITVPHQIAVTHTLPDIWVTRSANAS